jgi:hypothetical protein
MEPLLNFNIYQKMKHGNQFSKIRIQTIKFNSFIYIFLIIFEASFPIQNKTRLDYTRNKNILQT